MLDQAVFRCLRATSVNKTEISALMEIAFFDSTVNIVNI